MNGLGITIIVGQLPKLFGFSTDADGFLRGDRAVLPHTSTRPHATTLVVGVGRARRAARAAAHPAADPRDPGRRRRRRPSSPPCSTCPPTAWRRWARSPAAFRRPSFPWTSISDVGPLLIAAVGITLVSLTDTIATATSFAARRGDEVDPDQEMIGLGAANLAAGLFQGFSVSTSGSRTAVAEQSGAKSQLTGVVGAGLVVVLLLFLNSLLADLPQTALAAVVITAALVADGPRRAAPVLPGPEVVARPLARRDRRRRALRRARGHRHRDRAVDPHVLPAQLVAPRRGAGRGRRPRRLAQHRDLSRGASAPGHRRVPLGSPALLRQRRRVPHPDPPARPRAATRVDRPAVRGDHRHRRHRRRHAQAARRRAQRRRASTSRSPRCAAGCRTSS